MKLLIARDPPAFLDLDAPTIAADPVTCPDTGRLLWRIECPYCGREHRHGPMEGHREAHCLVATGESHRGYNLALRAAWRRVAGPNTD